MIGWLMPKRRWFIDSLVAKLLGFLSAERLTIHPMIVQPTKNKTMYRMITSVVPFSLSAQRTESFATLYVNSKTCVSSLDRSVRKNSKRATQTSVPLSRSMSHFTPSFAAHACISTFAW